MHSQPKFLIVIAGATATGKTTLAIKLAKHFNTEILSADSRQFYRELFIGTAKPHTSELEEVKHHFINSLNIDEDYSVGDFERDALLVLKQIFETKDVAVLAGGSGFYIQAVCEGLDEFPEIPTSVRESLNELFKNKGIEKLRSLSLIIMLL